MAFFRKSQNIVFFFRKAKILAFFALFGKTWTEMLLMTKIMIILLMKPKTFKNKYRWTNKQADRQQDLWNNCFHKILLLEQTQTDNNDQLLINQQFSALKFVPQNQSGLCSLGRILCNRQGFKSWKINQRKHISTFRELGSS